MPNAAEVSKSNETNFKLDRSSNLNSLVAYSVLFDPNEIVEDNSMVAMIVKQNTNLL